MFVFCICSNQKSNFSPQKSVYGPHTYRSEVTIDYVLTMFCPGADLFSCHSFIVLLLRITVQKV